MGGTSAACGCSGEGAHDNQVIQGLLTKALMQIFVNSTGGTACKWLQGRLKR